MQDTAPVSTETAAPADPVMNFDMTLDEFCAQLSATDRRIELIGGFNHSARQAGHLKGSEASFRERFEQFINKPV